MVRNAMLLTGSQTLHSPPAALGCLDPIMHLRNFPCLLLNKNSLTSQLPHGPLHLFCICFLADELGTGCFLEAFSM